MTLIQDELFSIFKSIYILRVYILILLISLSNYITTILISGCYEFPIRIANCLVSILLIRFKCISACMFVYIKLLRSKLYTICYLLDRYYQTFKVNDLHASFPFYRRKIFLVNPYLKLLFHRVLECIDVTSLLCRSHVHASVALFLLI